MSWLRWTIHKNRVGECGGEEEEGMPHIFAHNVESSRVTRRQLWHTFVTRMGQMQS